MRQLEGEASGFGNALHPADQPFGGGGESQRAGGQRALGYPNRRE